MRTLSRSDIAKQLGDNPERSAGDIRLEPEEFCNKWIPKIYGIQPGESLYTKACIEEFLLILGTTGLTERSIRSNWSWLGGQRRYPSYLPIVLRLVDRQYGVLDLLGYLPTRQVSRGNDPG